MDDAASSMRLALAAVFLLGCPGTTTTRVQIRDPQSSSVDVENIYGRRELLPASSASGELPGVAFATRAPNGAIDVRCASCFGDTSTRRLVWEEGLTAFDGAASDLLVWQPNALRVRIPPEGGAPTARVVLVVPKAALVSVHEWRSVDKDLGWGLFYLGSPTATVGAALIGGGASSSGAGRAVLYATGIPLTVLGIAGLITGLVYIFSPAYEKYLYPPQ
jgi:hypothetical protein